MLCMNLKNGDRVMVKGIQYEVLNVVEEAESSIPPRIKSYTAIYLYRSEDKSTEPSLVLQLKKGDIYTITPEKVRTKLKESDFKLIS